MSARPLPPDLWERLVDDHPPTLAQRAAGHGWDPHSIRWPSIAASCLVDDQPLDEAQWRELHEAGGLADHEVDLLAAVVAQLSARAVQASLTDRLKGDPAFRLEMDYCGPKGIAHSVFAGWSEHDRDAALSWHLWSRAACPSCGTRPEEWNPELGGDLHAYHAARHTCQGCVVRHRGEQALTKDLDKGKARPGTTIVLLPTPREVVPDGGDRMDQNLRAGQVQAPREAAPGRGPGGPAAQAHEGDPPPG
ncbi:MAG: hypothetical protein AB7G23_20275 [Vicinamibacterales bacterium]